MNAFGSRPEEQMLTDQIDDEYDVMNDETFGGEVPNDEWEVEQATDDIESNDAAVAAAMLERSMLDFAAARLPIGDDPLDFLEQSISQMVEDDDDLMFRGQRKSSNSKPLTDIFAPGSPQTPFFQLDKSNSIWSESTLKKPAPQANANAPSAAAVSGLFERLRVNGGENFGGLPPPTEQAPILVKGAKTAEELEAEMFGMSIPPSTNRSISIDPAIQQSQQPPKVMIKSCQELEREFIESSRAAAAMATLARQQSMPENVANFAQQPPTMPPAALAQQQIQNMLIRQPPPPPHAMLANPQVRAALMARWMAANPGAMPPVWFRMPPPPMMPPPGAGFRPPIIRPGQNMAQMNFNNARMPQQQQPPHGVDPRAAIGFMFQQGVRRTSPNFPKRRLFDSPNRFGHDDHYEHRDNNRNNRGREREYYIQDPNDPFAGLMSRRERSWLIKIQTLQLYSENPYVDDYYWMMYRRRKAAATDGNSLICKDADHNDNFEHRVYVPPQFEGSLGKVQVLSANFPRQVLDLAASSTNGDGKQQSTDDGSPRDSPPIKGGMQTVAGRRLKNVLIEIENLYLMLLEANDLTIMQEQNASSGTADDTREKTSARIKHLVQTILAALVTEDRIVSAISIRKGRRLLFQLAVHCTNDDCFKIMQAILGNLLPIAKREPHEEVFAVIQMITDSKLKTLNETDWSLLWEAIKIDTIENVLKYKLGNLIFLLLLQRLAVANITLSEGALKAVERWATVVYTNFTSSNNDEKGRAFTLEKRQAELLSSWLKNTSVPASVVDAIELRLTV